MPSRNRIRGFSFVTITIDRAGATHFYRFDAKAEQEIGVQLLTAALGSKLEPVLELTDSNSYPLSSGLVGCCTMSRAR